VKTAWADRQPHVGIRRYGSSKLRNSVNSFLSNKKHAQAVGKQIMISGFRCETGNMTRDEESAGGRGANVQLKGFQQLPGLAGRKRYFLIGTKRRRKHHNRRYSYGGVSHQTGEANPGVE
jgi:hypothetical protein